MRVTAGNYSGVGGRTVEGVPGGRREENSHVISGNEHCSIS